ncbi:MAG TPA: sigma-70 family RNA polymerase sigma factor [Candidatus Acidoferrum sp.]|nr:sigma-70 family RNA polymerase sigma factor [Candidatus Acidoferrum sp.]
MDFFPFDKPYLERLRAGDAETQRHFASYFGKFLRIRFRARRLSPDVIDDLVQDTLLRVVVKVHKGEVRQAECFGAFVNSVSNHVLLEYFRQASKNSHGDDGFIEVLDKVLDLDCLLITQQTVKRVRWVLGQLPEKDRRILRRLFFDEEDKDLICNEFGVNRDYLRVLVLRAKDKFRVLYK